MKSRPLLLAIGLGSLTAISTLHAQEATNAQKSAAAYQKALQLEANHDAAGAKAAYEAALRFDSRNANARHRLGQLKLRFDQVEAKGREKQFSTVQIPEFRVEDAEFGEALRALALLTEKATNEEFYPNFIIQDPTKILASRKVSLQMKGAPAGPILNQLLEMVQAKARFDKHAIVIMPR